MGILSSILKQGINIAATAAGGPIAGLAASAVTGEGSPSQRIVGAGGNFATQQIAGSIFNGDPTPASGSTLAENFGGQVQGSFIPDELMQQAQGDPLSRFAIEDIMKKVQGGGLTNIGGNF